MAIKHAAAKALRQARKAASKNRAMRTALTKFRKQALRAAADKKTDAAKEAFRLFGKAADKAAQKGVISVNTAARLKSRLSSALRRSA